MKTITLDFEVYEDELNSEYERGKANGTEGMKKANKLISSIVKRDYSIKEQEFYIWLRDYGDKS